MAQTKKVKSIVVDGYTFPMHSSYIFDLKKVYTTEVARTLDGSIPVFPTKIFVPYFTIKWAILKLDKYYEIMKRIAVDENTVEYYDSFAGEYKTAKFYAQQPTISDFIAVDGDYQYVKDLQLVFAGTLNDKVDEDTGEENLNTELTEQDIEIENLSKAIDVLIAQS